MAQLFDVDKNSLDEMVRPKEIKSTLWSMKPHKAPGPNRLHAGFFQRFWHTVGGSITKEVLRAFPDRNIPDYLNKIHIVLIPEMQGPEAIVNYRPISLCNLVYKIISKIIVARIRPFLDRLICLYEAAFVRGRRGVDNFIIVQELIHSIGRTKGKNGLMVIKIDLEKAYDKIEWSFIREMIFSFNLSSNLIELIMTCVSSILSTLLFNGGYLESL